MFLPVVVDQLDLLVRPVVSVAVVDEDVEAVPLRPHVNEESHGVAHMDRARNPVARQPVTRPDLHEALWWGESEDHGVGSVSSGQAEILKLTAITRKAFYWTL